MNFKERDFLRLLRENESSINQNHYKDCLIIFIEEVVKNNKTVQALFTNCLSELQDQIITDYLKSTAKYKDLAFSFMIWKRDLIKGVGYGLSLNHQPSSQLR